MQRERLLIFISILAAVNVLSALDLQSIKNQQTSPVGIVGTPPLTTSTVGTCNLGCQNGWVPYRGYCYIKKITVLTQDAAEKECVELGAHLTSLQTSEEATAVQNLVLAAPLFADNLLSFTSSNQATWIGLTKTNNGEWKWTDSSNVKFTNLQGGTSASGASCVSMNMSGVWQPNDCSSTASSFICKMSSFL